jgi:imidazolonepropionase-like amidohydrolase
LDKILASATINNAKALNLTESGSLALGMKANMLLLTDNPLEKIEAYNSIEKVILAGKVIERESLSVK